MNLRSYSSLDGRRLFCALFVGAALNIGFFLVAYSPWIRHPHVA